MAGDVEIIEIVTDVMLNLSLATAGRDDFERSSQGSPLVEPDKYRRYVARRISTALLPLIAEREQASRIDERTQVYYVAHDILADKRIPRKDALEHFDNRLAELNQSQDKETK